MAYFTVNSADNRIEIHFGNKPSLSIRELMKSNGWRWNSYEKYWFHYVSAHNKEVAQQICDAANGGSTSTTPPKKEIKPTATKTVTTKPERKPELPCELRPPVVKSFRKDEPVVFSIDGIKRYGEVIIPDDGKSCVIFKKSIDESGVAQFETAWLANYDLTHSTYVRQTTVPADGCVVDFEDERGAVVKGIVANSYYSTVDIVVFDVSDTGRISRKLYSRVNINRVLEKWYYATEDVLPLKVGDRVEYVSDEGVRRTGKVVKYLAGYNDIKVEYVKVDEWKDRWTLHDYIKVTDAVKLTGLRKKLRREDYIDETYDEQIQYNENVKDRIRARVDTFSDATHAASQKPLFKHQLAGCLLAEKYNKFAFFYDTGTGKTVMALNIIETKYRAEGIRFLIIAPKSIIKTAWLDDASNFYPSMRILPLYKGFDAYKKRGLYRAWRTGKSRSTVENDKVFLAHIKFLADVYGFQDPEDFTSAQIDQFLASEAQHYIINPELFIINPDKYINELGITALIVDESAIMKNYDSKTAKTIRDIGERLKYVYLLSGKPAPNNEVEFFSQMKVVAPEMFNFSYDRFIATFCVNRGNRVCINPENRDLFAEMVSAKSLIISKKDCLDLPDTVEVVRLIDLPEDIMDDYNELYYECMVLIKGMDESSLFYSTQSKMAVLMKLRQMASGFFMQKTDRGTENRVIIDIHKAKIDEVLSIIEEIPDEQIIIWCQFQHEIELLEKELSAYGETVTAYGKTSTLEENIDDFKNGRAKYIIAHPKTLKYGVTFTNCKYAIYYSFSYSAEDYDQSHDRNYRLGQKESCTYFFLQAADTIDEIMYEKVMYKLSNAEFFEQLVKDAEKHGIDYSSLKGVPDEKIKAELSNYEGISTVQDQIIERSERREKEKIRALMEEALNSGVSDTDYTDLTPEPTDEELFALERELARAERRMGGKELPVPSNPNVKFIYNNRIVPDCLSVYDPYPIDDLTIEDVLSSIPVTYDQVDAFGDVDFDFDRMLLDDRLMRAETEEPNIYLANEPEELQALLEDHPTKERWVAEMYRHVFHTLERLPSLITEIIRLKYGLNDGIRRANTTVSDMIYSYYDEDEDKTYRCNAAKVSQGLSEGLETLKNDYDLGMFRGQVRQALGLTNDNQM